MGYKRKRNCLCCRGRYEGRDVSKMFLFDNADVPSSNECFFADIAMRVNCEAALVANNLNPVFAKQVAKMAKRQVEQLACFQSPGERQAHAPLIASFDRCEITLGSLLGTGGFSHVYEVKEIHTRNSRCFSKEQRVVREFLASRALCKSESPKQALDSHQTNLDNHSTTRGEYPPVGRYAVKHLKPALMDRPHRFAKAAIDLATEAEMMLCLEHPNIIKMRGWARKGAFSYKDGKHDSFFIILDRVVDTLEDRVRDWRKQWKKERRRRPRKQLTKWLKTFIETGSCTKPPIKPKSQRLDSLFADRLKVAYDVAGAIQYLHDRRIIYRDLKPSNIGFDIDGVVKLFDFGLARFLPESEDDETCYRMSNVGTYSYVPPEVTEKKPYNLKADIYSFGVLLWEIMALSSAKHVRGKSLTPCPCWPTVLQTLVSSMLSTDPSLRPAIEQVRDTLKDLLLFAVGTEKSAGLFYEGEKCQQRSTFQVQLLDMSDLAMRDPDGSGDEEDTNLHSHSSVCTFSTHQETSSRI